MLYQRRNLEMDTDIGEPGPLPDNINSFPDTALADLDAVLDPRAAAELGYAHHGFFPVAPEPASVTEVAMWRVEVVLRRHERWQDTLDLIAAIPDADDRMEAEVKLNRTPNLVITSAIAQYMKAGLGLSDETFDDYITEALALT